MSATTAPLGRRALMGPRYSLRLLLVAFTVFAIGFPIWYRWPYQESLDEATIAPADPFAAPAAKPAKRTPAAKPAKLKRIVVTTWQRQWGGERLKHGPETTYQDGEPILRATYHRGILHGPYETWRRNRMGQAVQYDLGQYVQGKKNGEWRQLDSSGALRQAVQWRDDQLDGLAVLYRDKSSRQFLFEQGRLIAADGEKVVDRLGELVAAGEIDHPEIAQQLSSLTDIEFIETPLRDAVEFLAEKHEIPMVVDPWHADPARPLTNQLQGMQLSWALLTLTAPIDHACDYRYGCLWVTSAADAQNWKDPTGVADIVPPKGSQLARSWNEPINVETINLPLADVIEQQLIARLAITVDVSQIRPKVESEAVFPNTVRLKGLPFKHGLGFLLYKARCRCELRGETLVILPQELPRE
jgi:hypothetical protein